MISMGFTMFMRSSEITQLTWGRIDLDKRLIVLTPDDTKTKQGRKINISSVVYEMLVSRESKDHGAALFGNRFDVNKPMSRQGYKNQWKATKANAGVKCRFHDLRHSGLTRAFKTSNQWAQICHAAGLSLEEAEKTYLHITHEDTRFCAELISIPNDNSDKSVTPKLIEMERTT